MQPLAQDFPVVPNDKGGFNILLKPTATAATLTPPPAPSMAAPALREDRATRERGGPGANWVDQIGQIGATGDSRAQYEPPPDMGGTALPESTGPLGRMLGEGPTNAIAGIAGGLGTIDRNQRPLEAFGAGLSGAMTTRDNRRASKRKEMLEMEDRQLRREELKYQHGRDEFRDQFLLTEEQRRQAAEGRAAKGEERDELQDVLGVQVKQAELKKVNIELERLATSKGLTVDQGLEAVKQGVALTEREWTDVEVDDDNRDDYQQSLIRNTQAVIQQLTAATGSTAGGAPAGGASGTGSQATPISWAPGAAPRDAATFKQQMDAAVAANGGQPVYYINPANPNGPALRYSGRAGGIGSPV